jgi:hypothetical protein
VEVLPRTKTTIATKRALVLVFFIGTKHLIVGLLPREQKFNQDDLRVMIIL